MCNKLSFACEAEGIDTMWLEYFDGEVGYNANYHQWYEELVPPCELSYKEDACEWCVHYSRHDSGHAVEGAVFGGKEACRAKFEDEKFIPQCGKNESCYAAYEEAWGKDSSASSSSVCGSRGENFKDKDKGEIYEESIVGAIEECIVHYGVGRGIVEKLVDDIVTFTVERREEVDEYTEHY